MKINGLKPIGCLWPLSIPYQAAVQVRNRLYDLDIISAVDPGAPVISIGNLSVGGTGKTPFVLLTLSRLKQLSIIRKVKIAIISRGYGGKGRGTIVVSDGRRTLADPVTAGDEPVMMADRKSGAIIIVDRNRVRGACVAVKEFNAGLIILDDGFQHRRIKRNLDIVLLDAQNPVGNRRVLPAGVLREPVGALKRANLIVLSKGETSDEEQSQRADDLSNLLSKPVIATRLEPRLWNRINGKETLPLDAVKGRRVAAFAGIADTEIFFDYLRRLGADLTAWIPLPDHCRYTAAQVNHIARVFTKAQAEWLVTTEKDAVKLPLQFHILPTYILKVEMSIVHGAELLDRELTRLLSAVKKTGG